MTANDDIMNDKTNKTFDNDLDEMVASGGVPVAHKLVINVIELEKLKYELSKKAELAACCDVG